MERKGVYLSGQEVDLLLNRMTLNLKDDVSLKEFIAFGSPKTLS